MPQLRCEICHDTQGVYEDRRNNMHVGFLCMSCVEAITQLGNTVESLKRVIAYLKHVDINTSYCPCVLVDVPYKCSNCGTESRGSI